MFLSLPVLADPTIYRLPPGHVCAWGYEQSLPNGNATDSWCVKPNDWMSNDTPITFDFRAMEYGYSLYRPEQDQLCKPGYVRNFRGFKNVLWCSELNENLFSYKPVALDKCENAYVANVRGPDNVYCDIINENLAEYRPLPTDLCLDGFEDTTKGLDHYRWCIRK